MNVATEWKDKRAIDIQRVPRLTIHERNATCYIATALFSMRKRVTLSSFVTQSNFCMLGKFAQIILTAANMHTLPNCQTALSLIAAFNFQLLRMCYGVKRTVKNTHDNVLQRISYDHPDCWQGKRFNRAQNVNEISRA